MKKIVLQTLGDLLMKLSLRAITALFTVLCVPSLCFAAAEAEKAVLKAQAALPDIVAAMKEFKGAGASIASENGVAVEALKADVVAYYRDQFGKEYEKKNGGAQWSALETHIAGINPDQAVAQFYYIAKNPNPLGSKHKLMQSDDKSTYSKLHGKYHPGFVKTLDENGLYDIFLIDPSGMNYYTVYKELDFFGNHLTGPNSSSGLGEVVQKALKAKKGEVVESRVDKYGYSYDVLALFIGTPIFDGDTLIGVMAYQVNP